MSVPGEPLSAVRVSSGQTSPARAPVVNEDDVDFLASETEGRPLGEGSPAPDQETGAELEPVENGGTFDPFAKLGPSGKASSKFQRLDEEAGGVGDDTPRGGLKPTAPGQLYGSPPADTDAARRAGAGGAAGSGFFDTMRNVPNMTSGEVRQRVKGLAEDGIKETKETVLKLGGIGLDGFSVVADEGREALNTLTSGAKKSASWLANFIDPRLLPERVRNWEWNFTRMFRVYLFLMILFWATILYLVNGGTYTFVDCIFMVGSAACVTGLATIDVHEMNTGSQVILFMAIICGSSVLMSVPPMVRRVWIYRKHFKSQERLIRAQHVLSDMDDDMQEYSALWVLSKVTVLYFIIIHLLSMLIVGWALGGSEALAAANVNRWWFALFMSVSAFNNAGFSLLTDSLISFATWPSVLLPLAFMIWAGNTGYPVMLRVSVWFAKKYAKNPAPYNYLMSTPRDVSYNLFEKKPTRILLFINAMLTLFAMLAHLARQNGEMDMFSGSQRILVSFFTSVSTRNAGFNVIDVGAADVVIQLLWIGLMYLSTYPFVITMKPTANKKSDSGVDYAEQHVDILSDALAGKSSKVKDTIKNTFVREISWLYLALMIICWMEADHVHAEPYQYGVYKILFELVSAFGCVGISFGYPGVATSFVTVMHNISKLTVVWIMALGRMRALPEPTDIAVGTKMKSERSAEARAEVRAIAEALAHHVHREEQI